MRLGVLGLTINELVDREIGTPVRPVVNPLISSVGTSVLQLLRNDPNRVGWSLINLSPNAMFILHESSVSTTNGLRVSPNGGSAITRWKDDYHWLAWDWFIVADAAASGLLIVTLVTN